MVNKVSKVTIDYLVNNGIDRFFFVTGGAIAPTIDYIGTKEGVEYYCFQHEQSAAMAAEAYYRVSGKIGAVLTTSGPGAQNLMNGLCGCWFESVPCLFITGQVSTNESSDFIDMNPRQLGFQETDVVPMFREFTKYCTKITSVDEVEHKLETALSSMKEGRFGPVLIDIPVNIQTTDIEDFSDKVIRKNDIVQSYDTDADILELNYMIKQSKRPLFLLGNGVRLSDAIPLAKDVIEETGIPFVVSWGGFDLLPHDHPQFVGDIGVYGSRGANFAVQNCDLLIVLGSRLDTRQTGGDLKLFSRHSKKVMVDIDRNEVFKGRGLEIDLPIIHDIKDFLDSFLDVVEVEQNTRLTSHAEWLDKIEVWKNKKYDEYESGDSLSSYNFLEVLNDNISDDSIIIPDEGGNLVWSMQSIKLKGTQRMFSNFGNSSMGYALPASIGASIGSDKPVICIDGDGGFQMNIQELQTIKHYNLPVKIFILNNRCYGIIKQFQDAYFDSRYIATEGKDYSSPKFSDVAKAYGIHSVVIDVNSNLDEEIKGVMSHDGPVLCEVMIDVNQKLTPKLEFGNPLEDMSPYMTDEELEENMIVDMVERRDNSQGWVTLKIDK
jgi:acetolactate synthase-1/2/3 large subunit